MVTDKIKGNAIKHIQCLQDHENFEMETVLNAAHNLRQLKRTKPYELAKLT